MTTLPSDFLLATMLRAIGDGVISCDHTGAIVLMNPVAQELTGWDEKEALGRKLRDVFVIVHEGTRAPVEDPIERVLRLGKVVGMANQTLLIRRDGAETAIDDSAAPVYDKDHKLRGVVLVFRDVTARRRAEWNLEMLSESGRVLGQARDLPEILHQITGVVSTHFADFCVFDLMTSDGTMTRHIGQHRLPEDQPLADAVRHFQPLSSDSTHPIARVLRTGKPLLLSGDSRGIEDEVGIDPERELYFRRQLKPHSLLFVPLMAGETLAGVLTFVRHRLQAPYSNLDVASAEELGKRVGLAVQHARTREELLVQRARLDAVLAAAPVGILMAERSGKVMMANEEVQRIFRHEIRYSQDVAGHEEYVAYHPDGRVVRGEEYPLPRAMAQNKVFRDERYIYARGDGTQAWIALSAAPVKDDTGKIWGGVVVISDIDQLVRAEAIAERSRKRLETMMNRASVGIAVGDLEGGLSYANDTLLQWIGYSKQEVERGEVRWDKLTPPEFAAQDARAIGELRADCYATPYEKAYIAKDGHRVPMLVGATCIPSLAGEQEDDIATFFTDLTLQKRAEQTLLQTEKLTAVGRLASSISHEINNPLEAVTNLLYIVRNSPNLLQSDRDYLDAADRELGRVAQITAQTLRFHRQSTAATSVRPEALFEEVLSLYRSRLEASDVLIQGDYGQGVAFTCFEGDIRQVLSNLVANAFDAMRRGGRLRLRTRFATWWNTGERGVMLTIADSGAGMTPEVQQRVFDAFYSTKGIHGTGLGLWISKRIVHKHRGHLRVRSRSGEASGTVFCLWMPIELAPSASEAWHADMSGLGH